MSDLVGKKLGDFKLLEEVGRGAMGVVFRARQLSMGRDVALKFLPSDMAEEKRWREQFLREARTAGQLNHPNIVLVHDTGKVKGLYYIAMEYVDGPSTAEWIDESGPFTEEEVVKIGMEMASALAVAHQAGILHRDIKPDNILLDSANNAKLADLGLALKQDPAKVGKGKRTKKTVGTPLYISPEQAQGIDLDGRADLFSLGSTLYALASGKTPFDGDDNEEILKQVVRHPHRPLKSLAPKLSPKFLEVVETLLKKKPDDRYKDAKALRDALRACIEKPEPSSVEAFPPAVTGSSKRISLGTRSTQRLTSIEFAEKKSSAWAWIGLVLLIALAVPFLFMTSRGSAPIEPVEKKEKKEVVAQPREDPQAIARYHELSADAPQMIKTNPAELVKAWDTYLANYPRSSYRAHAKRKRERAAEAEKKLEENWETVKAIVERASGEASKRMALSNLARFIAQYPESEQAKEAKAQVEQIKSFQVRQAKAKIAEGKRLTGAKQWDRARRVLYTLKGRDDLPTDVRSEWETAWNDLLKKERATQDQAKARSDAEKLLMGTATKVAGWVANSKGQFEFSRAAQAYRDTAGRAPCAWGREQAEQWADRYTRLDQVWKDTLAALEKGKRVSVPKLGRFSVPGQIVGAQKRGLQFTSKQLPGEQTVPWRDVKSERFLTLVAGASSRSGVERGLDVGLFAYALGVWKSAASALEPASRNAKLKVLASEPCRLAKAFASGKSMADMATKTSRPVRGTGSTEAKLAERLRSAGWDRVLGTWKRSKADKRLYVADNAALEVDTADARVSVMLRAGKGTTLFLWVRRTDGMADPNVPPSLEVASAYGLKVEGLLAKAYVPAGHVIRGEGQGKNRTPVKFKQWKLASGYHQFAVEVKGNRLEISVGGQVLTFNQPLFGGGRVELGVEGKLNFVGLPKLKKH